ncbi:glycosyl transferase family 1, partial [Mesorhizobium sp. M00.F.Ca.ET.186.01.1.1]
AYWKLYREWKENSSQAKSEAERGADFAERVKPYERREQARQLADLMNELLTR